MGTIYAGTRSSATPGPHQHHTEDHVARSAPVPQCQCHEPCDWTGHDMAWLCWREILAPTNPVCCAILWIMIRSHGGTLTCSNILYKKHVGCNLVLHASRHLRLGRAKLPVALRNVWFFLWNHNLNGYRSASFLPNLHEMPEAFPSQASPPSEHPKQKAAAVEQFQPGQGTMVKGANMSY